MLLYVSLNLNVVSLGSREQWTGVPGQGPGLCLAHEEGDGWSHAHPRSWNGGCGSGHPQRTLRQHDLGQKETSHPCSSSSCCAKRGNRSARSGCEEKETSSSHNSLHKGTVRGRFRSVRIVRSLHGYRDFLSFWTLVCDSTSHHFTKLLASLRICICQGGSRPADSMDQVSCFGWNINREVTIYLMMKHLTLQIYWINKNAELMSE